MKCEKVMKQMMSSDHGRLSFLAGIHCRSCPSCFVRYNEIKKMEKSLEGGWTHQAPLGFSDNVMRMIYSSEIEYGRNTTWLRWVATGIVILSSFFLVNFSDSFVWISKAMGDDFILPLNIVLSMVVTGYSAVFIASHGAKLAQFRNVLLKR